MFDCELALIWVPQEIVHADSQSPGDLCSQDGILTVCYYAPTGNCAAKERIYNVCNFDIRISAKSVANTRVNNTFVKKYGNAFFK